MNLFQQYNRKESIEVSGIPENILQKDLENTMIGVLRRVGLWGLESYEIAACHRLKRKVNNEKTSRVIIRFINRKRTYKCLENRKRLKDTIWEFPNIYIHNSLCQKYKDIYEKCTEVRLCGVINKFWTFNGIIHIKRTANFNEKPKRILHIKDLRALQGEVPGETFHLNINVSNYLLLSTRPVTI